ncbi:hypothetical protein D9758_012683 [Tetrapyrgos nigripes]|uniref:Uncharacterized protein n=1 Tax=Tetrapyrgos nigripes TaxID=182062 RepID=A0A8H5CXQ7_9AGAR|nr:hypothetical protein D9758_012683 [Tetrapyrgos nigripes]
MKTDDLDDVFSSLVSDDAYLEPGDELYTLVPQLQHLRLETFSRSPLALEGLVEMIKSRRVFAPGCSPVNHVACLERLVLLSYQVDLRLRQPEDFQALEELGSEGLDLDVSLFWAQGRRVAMLEPSLLHNF